MINMPNPSKVQTVPFENTPNWDTPNTGIPISVEEMPNPLVVFPEKETESAPATIPGLVPGMGSLVLTDTPSLSDLPPVVITNSFDDDDDDDMDEVVDDDDDEDIYEEVEAFEDFDDDFDDDFEDEFDEDYEDLARIDDEDFEDETDDDGNGTPSRYEEEFGDIDGQTRFIPDSADLSEEILLGDDDLEDGNTNGFGSFNDDEENEAFNEFDN